MRGWLQAVSNGGEKGVYGIHAAYQSTGTMRDRTCGTAGMDTGGTIAAVSGTSRRPLATHTEHPGRPGRGLRTRDDARDMHDNC